MLKNIFLRTLFVLATCLPFGSYACHLVSITETNAVDNGDGTYTYTFDICVGIEDTYGFYLDFTGANLISFPANVTGPTTGNTINASSPPVSGTGDVEYGDWDSNAGLLFSGVGNECVSMSFTFDGSISQVDIGGTQAFFTGGPCAGTLTTTTCFASSSTYTVTISVSNNNNQFYSFGMDGTTLLSGVPANGQTDTYYVCGCASTFSVNGTGPVSIPSWSVVQNGVGPSGAGVSETTNSPLTPCVILPVEFINFDVEKDDCVNALSWSTASEINNDYFKLERSYDSESWNLITTIKGAGTTSYEKRYTYTDRDYSQNGVIYYRLSQVDFDGHEEILQTRAVSSFCNENNEPIAHPNPMHNELTVESILPVQVTIKDMKGAVLRNLSLDKGINTINVEEFAEGTYLVEIQSNQGQFIQKIVKL